RPRAVRPRGKDGERRPSWTRTATPRRPARSRRPQASELRAPPRAAGSPHARRVDDIDAPKKPLCSSYERSEVSAARPRGRPRGRKRRFVRASNAGRECRRDDLHAERGTKHRAARERTVRYPRIPRHLVRAVWLSHALPRPDLACRRRLLQLGLSRLGSRSEYGRVPRDVEPGAGSGPAEPPWGARYARVAQHSDDRALPERIT